MSSNITLLYRNHEKSLEVMPKLGSSVENNRKLVLLKMRGNQLSIDLHNNSRFKLPNLTNLNLNLNNRQQKADDTLK